MMSILTSKDHRGNLSMSRCFSWRGTAVPLPPVLLTATAPAVWGSTYVITTTLLPDGRPLLAGVLRALPAGLLLLALTRTLPRGS
jgi:hypothetical protein